MTLLIVDIPDEVMDIIDTLANDRIMPKYTNRSDVAYAALREFLMEVQGDQRYKKHIDDFVERIDVALDVLERRVRERRERRSLGDSKK